MKIVAILFLALALGYSGYLAALYLGQDGMVFPTRPTDPARAEQIKKYYKNIQSFAVNAADGPVLRGFFLPRWREGRPAPAVLYFCGNSEEQSNFFLWSPGELAPYSVAGVDYRGYGDSQGKPTETALRADALAVYDALAAKLGPDVPIVVMGRSLGSGLAAHVAAKRAVAGVILVTPYDSLAAVGREAHPFAPVGWLLRHPFDVAPDAARVKAPTLMLVAGADTLIPPSHALRLAAMWAAPKDVQTVEGASHNSILDSPMYWKLIRGFLDRLTAGDGGQTDQAVAATPPS
jgi:pimeloyl-ACP methyl ester carboxylesterase